MSYKYSSGNQIIGDLSGSDDSNRNTGIDFEEDYISLRANNNDVLVVSGSKVGIGTTSPGTNLVVAGDDARIRIDGNTDSHPGYELSENGTRKWIIFNDYTNDNLTFKTNSNTRMSIEQAGDVGIGTTSPDEKLHIAGNLKVDGDAPEVTVRRDNNADASTIQFQGSGGVVGAYVKFLGDESGAGGTNNDLALGTGASVAERIRIRGDGKVGIGTTSPIAELDVAGKIAITAEVATPSQPADGKGYLYTKSDGKIYWRSHDVSETDLTATGGGGSGDALGATAQKTSNYTASNWDFVLVNLVGASSDVTITLPAASSDAQVAIKIAGVANGKTVTVDGNSSETIDGATTKIMDSDYESMHLISDGSNWWRIS